MTNLHVRMANGNLELVTLDDRGVVTYAPDKVRWIMWMPWLDVVSQLADFGHVVEER